MKSSKGSFRSLRSAQTLLFGVLPCFVLLLSMVQFWTVQGSDVSNVNNPYAYSPDLQNYLSFDDYKPTVGKVSYTASAVMNITQPAVLPASNHTASKPLGSQSGAAPLLKGASGLDTTHEGKTVLQMAESLMGVTSPEEPNIVPGFVRITAAVAGIIGSSAVGGACCGCCLQKSKTGAGCCNWCCKCCDAVLDTCCPCCDAKCCGEGCKCCAKTCKCCNGCCVGCPEVCGCDPNCGCCRRCIACCPCCCQSPHGHAQDCPPPPFHPPHHDLHFTKYPPHYSHVDSMFPSHISGSTKVSSTKSSSTDTSKDAKLSYTSVNLSQSNENTVPIGYLN